MEYIEDITALVVDDSEFFASLTADQLETKHGMNAQTASSPETALDELQDLDVDVVVSDYDMPEMDGLEFYEAVDERIPEMPFILLTGRTDGDIASSAISAGVDDYLQKEAVAERNDFEVLANRIQNVVNQRKSRQKYELVVDNTPEGIAQVSRDGTIMAANERVAESFGVPSDDIVGANVGEVLPDKIANRWLAYGDDALTTGERVSFESSYDGRYFHTYAVPVNVGGETDTFQIISRDITQRREREQELETRTEQLELINRFVRHDIRNDIDLVYSWSELLRDHVDEDGQEYIDRIRSTSDHITELTTIAGEFVETVSSDSDAQLEAIPLRHALGEELEKCRSSYEAASFTLNGDIPAVDVRANGMLSSVFRNLLNNAVQHNDADHPQVYVTATDHGGTVEVTVADNGPGVPDDQKQTIFGKGDQGAASAGTGIGLYLVHTLVTQYGGTVTVEDSDIGGARFVVELQTV
ncbi:MAG: response regulator [Haloarculaceae archaeon]